MSTPLGPPGSGTWTQVFFDDFETAYTTPYGTGPNPAVWADHLLQGDQRRVNNTNEYQWYPHGYYGCSVANSILTLTAKYQNPQLIDPACPSPMQPGGQVGQFTSGMVQSKPGFAFTEGYVEASIQNPNATTSGGIWPAFWLVPADDGWPPEIDMDEFNVYHTPGNIVNSAYDTTSGTWSQYDLTQDDGQFHVYGCLIQGTTVTYYLDGTEYTSFTTDGIAYPWTVVLNLAVWNGATDGAGYPAEYNIDYVAAYVPSGAPAAPVISSVSPASGVPTGGSAQVSFSEVSGATSYRVTACAVDSMADNVPWISGGHTLATGTSSPITITGLTDGARYTYSVCAISSNGYSPESALVPTLAAAPNAPVSSLSDPLTSFNQDVWQQWAPASACSYASNGLTLTEAASTTTYVGVETIQPYNMVNGEVFVQVVDAGTQTVGSPWTIELAITESSGDLVSIYAGAGSLIARREEGGTTTVLATQVWNATAMAWWRIREASGITYFDVAPDGVNWVNIASVLDSLDFSNVKVTLDAGTWADVTTAQSGAFTNLNVAPPAAAVSVSLAVTPEAPEEGSTVTATYTVTDSATEAETTVTGSVTVNGVQYPASATVELPATTPTITYATPTAPGLTFAATSTPGVFTATV